MLQKVGKMAARHPLVLMTVAFLCALPVATRAAEPAREPMHGFFSAQVTVDSTGKIVVHGVSGLKGAIAGAVEAKLAEVKAVPAQRAGAAIEASMVMQGRAVLTPVDADNYALALDHLLLLPRAAAAELIVPPRYPVEMYTRDREGSVEMELTINEAGRITDTRVVSSTQPAFTKAVLAAAKQWKFDASNEGAKVSVPVVFRIAGKRPAPTQPKFDCALPAGQAHIAGQNGCLSLIEVVGSRVYRATTNVR